jgi:hypothetical protein
MLQIDPYHFNGITSETRRAGFTCDDIWYQHDYQASGKLSRESVALALRQAEDLAVTYLRFTPIPQWQEEVVQTTPYYKTNTRRFVNSKRKAKSVEASFGLVT